ncbi:hypothetical protein MKX01_026329 [Papaver californicum]|nr:hypothetical protein MKX01_026329 [Papaver californicum]
MAGYVGKDGKVHPSFVEKYEKVKAPRPKRKCLMDAGLVSALDFENDEIAEVFGPDKGRTGFLGYSPHISKKQALYASLATQSWLQKQTRRIMHQGMTIWTRLYCKNMMN